MPQLLWEPSQLLNRVSVRLISSCQLSLSSGCSPASSLPTPLCGDCCVCPCQCKKSEHNVLPGIFIGLTTPWRLQGNHKMQKAHSQSSRSPQPPLSLLLLLLLPSHSFCTSNSFELLSIHCGSPATPTQPRPHPSPPHRFVLNVQRKQHAIFFSSCSAFCMSFSCPNQEHIH